MIPTSRIERKLTEYIHRAYPLSSEVIRQLADRASVKKISRSDILCAEGEIFDKLVFVSEGIFRISRIMNGEDDTIAFGEEGDPYLSLATYLYDQPSLWSYNPVTDGEVIMVDNQDLRELVDTTELMNWFNRVLLRQVHALENRYVWLGQQDAYSRYLRLQKLRPDVFNNVPLKYIASYLGVTQSTLSRIRARIVGK
ncbi:MAG: Crp/Fnr family transcriptional regulator [Muribaculaceae bacterium]|nr:Crp/Fnr family transcriptional regulator [Muribaculaceae bacterium]